jgi:hypothetical protein
MYRRGLAADHAADAAGIDSETGYELVTDAAMLFILIHFFGERGFRLK